MASERGADTFHPHTFTVVVIELDVEDEVVALGDIGVDLAVVQFEDALELEHMLELHTIGLLADVH